MERLTERNARGVAYYPYCFEVNTCDGEGSSEKCNGCDFSDKLCERLADYEDTGYSPDEVVEMAQELEELKKQLPPCKIGDTVYIVGGDSLTVREIHIQDNLVKYFVARFNPNGLDVRFTFDKVGKTVFLTKEEADDKLKEMESK